MINLGNALPAGFVPPPRLIADIAAILDNEKPDQATLASRTPTPTTSRTRQSVSDLARSYYERANARLLLDRHAEAAADAEKAPPSPRRAEIRCSSSGSGNSSVCRRSSPAT